MDIDTFIFYIKTENIYIDIEKRFDTSNYDEVERPVPIKKSNNFYINGRRIRWKDHDNVYSMKTKDI